MVSLRGSLRDARTGRSAGTGAAPARRPFATRRGAATTVATAAHRGEMEDGHAVQELWDDARAHLLRPRDVADGQLVRRRGCAGRCRDVLPTARLRVRAVPPRPAARVRIARRDLQRLRLLLVVLV